MEEKMHQAIRKPYEPQGKSLDYHHGPYEPKGKSLYYHDGMSQLMFSSYFIKINTPKHKTFSSFFINI